MVFDIGAAALLENVTLTGNGGGAVGAISNDGFSRLDILNGTITLNGGVAGMPLPLTGGIRDVHGGAGLTYLANTYLAGNFAQTVAGVPDCNNGFSMGGNIIGDAQRCQQFAPQPDDQLDVVPPLLALADHGGFTQTHRPAQGASAIDRDVRRTVPRRTSGAWRGRRMAMAMARAPAMSVPSKSRSTRFSQAGSRRLRRRGTFHPRSGRPRVLSRSIGNGFVLMAGALPVLVARIQGFFWRP
ncbi:hypothetical protein [Pseudofulvimonas gallinarii]|uniref:hypothetical protein n=1 Tax=Pseudofulvimonas gallinarii TaxID=634155 RepID=UPI000F4AA49C|nr:hypothetical protein [Pseudofulvimonas gallinarii]